MGAGMGQSAAGGSGGQLGTAMQGLIANSPFARAIQTMQQVGQQPTASVGQAGDAIAGIESAGSGDYSAVGPRDAKLGRMLGRYQIAEANVGPWSQEVFGKAMTPEQFLADPKAQDAVFKHKFGQYVEKYGPEGAARAWHGGEGNVNNPDARDKLGTSVGEYGQKFMANLGADARQSAEGNNLTYTNQSAIRKQRLDPRLETMISTAVTDVYGPGYKVQVYSGGQPSNEKGIGTGTTRHNHGKAADVYIIDPNGRRLHGDDLAPIAQYWQAKGLGGTGLEMAGGGIHLDEHTDRARTWNYGPLTAKQAAAFTAGGRGELPPLYSDTMQSRMFGSGATGDGSGQMAAGSGKDAPYEPGQGEQLQKALGKQNPTTGQRRGGGGIPSVERGGGGGSGGATSRRAELLARAKSMIPGEDPRAAQRRQRLQQRVRGQA